MPKLPRLPKITLPYIYIYLSVPPTLITSVTFSSSDFELEPADGINQLKSSIKHAQVTSVFTSLDFWIFS